MNSTPQNGMISTTISQYPSNSSANIESAPRLTKNTTTRKRPFKDCLNQNTFLNKPSCFYPRFKQLDPFQLQEQMAAKIKHLIKNVTKYNEKNLIQK